MNGVHSGNQNGKLPSNPFEFESNRVFIKFRSPTHHPLHFITRSRPSCPESPVLLGENYNFLCAVIYPII
jgi:hypothetical protein